MEEMGLAAGMAQEQQKPMQDVNQIIQLLVNGVTPEELIAQGVPEELVQMAMAELSKDVTQVPPEQAGLAATMVRPERGM
jgi:hypothetical protein